MIFLNILSFFNHLTGVITARVRSTREGTVFTGVCLHFGRGVPHLAKRGEDGGYPIPGPGRGRGTPSSWWGVPLSQIQTGGVPHPRTWMGVTHPRSWQGVSHPSSRQGVPNPRSRSGAGTQATPHPGLDVVPPPIQDWMGYPPPPHSGLDEVPPPLSQEIEQHSEHLLRGGWYASCVHAGELFCYNWK